jgi:hypothetical protein
VTERVFDAILLFLHLDLSGPANTDHRNTAGEPPDALQLPVVVGGGFLDLRLDLADSGFDVELLPAPWTMRCFPSDDDLLGAAKHRGRHVMSLMRSSEIS